MPQPPRKVLKGIRTFDPKWMQNSFGMPWLKAASGGVRAFCEVCGTDLESRLDTLRDQERACQQNEQPEQQQEDDCLHYSKGRGIYCAF